MLNLHVPFRGIVRKWCHGEYDRETSGSPHAATLRVSRTRKFLSPFGRDREEPLSFSPSFSSPPLPRFTETTLAPNYTTDTYISKKAPCSAVDSRCGIPVSLSDCLIWRSSWRLQTNHETASKITQHNTAPHNMKETCAQEKTAGENRIEKKGGSNGRRKPRS
jgi:hypothetical protein